MMNAVENNSKQHHHNLLMDSLSSDDDDIPDLQLIPPAKVKKRKTRFRRLKLSGPSSSSNERSASEVALPRLWTICLTCVLFALVTGLVTLAWFTINIYHDLKNNPNTMSLMNHANTAHSEDQIARMNNLDRDQDLNSIKDELKEVSIKLKHLSEQQEFLLGRSGNDSALMNELVANLTARTKLLEDEVAKLNATVHGQLQEKRADLPSISPLFNDETLEQHSIRGHFDPLQTTDVPKNTTDKGRP